MPKISSLFQSGRQPGHQDGVTLFELLVVVALIGILSAATIPSYLKWRSDARYRNSVAQFIGDFRMAKGRAIRINANVVVKFEAGGYMVFEDNGSISGDGIHQSDESILSNRTFPPQIGIDMDSVTFENDRAQIDRRGAVFIPSDDSRQLILKGISDQETTFTINRLGQISTS